MSSGWSNICCVIIITFDKCENIGEDKYWIYIFDVYSENNEELIIGLTEGVHIKKETRNSLFLFSKVQK